MINQIQFL